MRRYPDESDPAIVATDVMLGPDGKMAVTEVTFDRAGAASPFGEDVSFPLPHGVINYDHPEESAAPNGERPAGPAQ